MGAIEGLTQLINRRAVCRWGHRGKREGGEGKGGEGGGGGGGGRVVKQLDAASLARMRQLAAKTEA